MTRRTVTGPVLACLLLAGCDGASWSDMAESVAGVRVSPDEPGLQVEVVDAGGKPVAPAAVRPSEPASASISTASVNAKPAPAIGAGAAPARVARAAEPVRKAAPAASAAGTAAVQLGAFRDEAAARAAWARYGDDPALAGLRPRYERIERPGASLVRLKAGPLQSVEQARAVCARLGLADPWCAKGRYADGT